MKLALLISGNLGFELFKIIIESEKVSAVLTDKESTEIIAFSRENGIKCFVGNPRNGKAGFFIKQVEIDLLLSINYLFLIEDDLINWPKLGAINFHGSLLPKFRGRTPHVWAIINNETKTGVTAHLITQGCDEGDIIKQVEIAIDSNDTGATILKKYNEVYPKLVMDIIDLFSKSNLDINRHAQDDSLATFFGKRTPEDGGINWAWQKERIRNWVRALSKPYPGAFSYVKDEKIIIDWIEFDEYGFQYDQPNGLVLTINPPRVKTQNGVVRLTSIRMGQELLHENDILN